MRTQIIEHPLVAHKLTLLRDRNTPSPVFRQLVDELVTLLAYEATRDVAVREVDVVTPVAPTKGLSLAYPRPILVPILRAGLGMLEGMSKLLPTAEIGFLGMKRDETTLEAHTYANRLPDDLSGRQCYVVDPMLATGGSLAATISLLKSKGCKDIKALVLVAAPEGVKAVTEAHPDVTVYTAALDSHLNENGYIIPGLGDAGDKIFGTRNCS